MIKKFILPVFAIIAIVGGALIMGGNDAASVDTVFAAASDYFLKIEGIEGESTDPNHKGYIDFDSFSWGMSRATSGGGGLTGRPVGQPSMSGFSFTKELDKSSPKLFSIFKNGELIKSAELRIRKAGQAEDYFKIEMKEILISSFAQSGDGNVEVESVMFNPKEITITKLGR